MQWSQTSKHRLDMPIHSLSKRRYAGVPDIDISATTCAPNVGLLGSLLYGPAIQFSDAKHIPLELPPLHRRPLAAAR